MANNRYGGSCYYCGNWVEKQAGHFERHKGKFRVIHGECVLKQREEKEKKK